MRHSDLHSSRQNFQAEFASKPNGGTATMTAPPAAEKEWMDDALHYGRAWHRYRYCYRSSQALQVLDAGCGTGRSSAWLAMLNPGAKVLGVDISPTLIEIARDSAKPKAFSASKVEFQEADLNQPLPESVGTFDFVACRKVLGEASDPALMLLNLAKAMKPDGLMFVSLPSRRGREAARTLRRVVDAFAEPGMPLAARSNIALEVYRGLRLDHPLRVEITEKLGTEPEKFLVDYLTDSKDWSLDEAISLLEGAGLKLLHASTPAGWRPDRVFNDNALEEGLNSRFHQLDPQNVSRLVDALDPSSTQQDHLLYACHQDFNPLVPSWPSNQGPNFELFDLLIPYPTGIARPLPNEGRSVSGGRVLYQTVSGAIGEIDRLSNLMLLASDGHGTVGEINLKLSGLTRASDNEQAKRDCWMNLADSGLVLLQPPEFRAGTSRMNRLNG